MKHSFTEEQLRNAVASTTSIRQLLLHLGLAAKGGNYAVLNRRISKLNIDISHYTGKLWSKGKKLGIKRPIEHYLSNEFPIQSYRLKRYLLETKIFQPICGSCNKTEWLNQPIPLELDHIDGNSSNNTLTNLRLLCPNCHAFTPTYRGKNKKRI